MRRQDLLLIVIAVLGLLVTLGLQGCGLFGGGDEETAEGEAAEGVPAEGGEPGMEGEMPAEPGMGGPPPAEGAPGEPGMGGPAPMGEAPAEGAAAGGGDASQLVAEGMAAKHDGNYVTAREKFEAAVAADDSNAEAHWGLAWIYAEMADAGQSSLEPKAVEQFQKFLELGGTQDQVAEAEAALERIQ